MTTTPSPPASRRQTVTQIALFLLLGVALLYPRSKQIAKYVFIDEAFYIKHAGRFYWALANQEYEYTYTVVHPGVTVNWLGATAFGLFFPELAEINNEPWVNEGKWFPDLRFRWALEKNDLSLILLLGYSRAFVAAANVGLLLAAFLLARRLVHPWAALLGVLLIGFDPFYFDFSRFLHVDGLMSTFMLVSLLSFLVYLREGKRGYLLLSAAAGGLGILTKVVAIVLLPIFGLIALIEWWRPERGRSPVFGAGRDWKGILRIAGMVLLWLAVTAALMFLLLPAMWSRAGEILTEIVGFVFDQSGAEVISPMYFNGQRNPTGVFGAAEYWNYYLISYLWRTTPVTLAGLLLLGLAAVFRPRLEGEAVSWRMVGRLALYSVAILILMTLSAKKFDRYILPVFLSLDLLAGIGYVIWLRWGLGKLKAGRRMGWLRPAFAGAGIVLIAVLQGWFLLDVFPHGLSYYNPLLGGGERAPEVMQVGYGEGLDEAAAYMMTVPNKRNLRIHVFYSNVFGFHFNRAVQDIDWYADEISPQLAHADYWIIYLSQKQRGMSPAVLEYVEGQTPEYTVVINGIEYAWIYNLHDIQH